MVWAPNPSNILVRLSLISPKQYDVSCHYYRKHCLTARALRDGQAASRRANMVQITGFKFVIAVTLALSLSTFSVFPGASAADGPRSQTAPTGRQTQQDRRLQNPQPVASPYIYKGA